MQRRGGLRILWNWKLLSDRSNHRHSPLTSSPHGWTLGGGGEGKASQASGNWGKMQLDGLRVPTITNYPKAVT
jgi:hypothetical protein